MSCHSLYLDVSSDLFLYLLIFIVLFFITFLWKHCDLLPKVTDFKIVTFIQTPSLIHFIWIRKDFCLPFTTLPLSSLSRQLSHTASCLSSLLYKQTEPRERGCFEGGRGGLVMLKMKMMKGRCRVFAGPSQLRCKHWVAGQLCPPGRPCKAWSRRVRWGVDTTLPSNPRAG